MTVAPHKPESAQSTHPLSEPELESEFNWRNCWYPICFRQDFPQDRPYSFSLYDEPFVIFQHQEELICLTDRCPHRAAKLSDGQIIDGKLECLYHGWQFGHEGECLHIPQLSADGTIPVNANVRSHKVVERQGLIWIWPGAAELADEQAIPTIPKLNKPGFVHSDKLTELPCDISYVIEHMLDPAHIHITHHGNQGDRAKAQPLEMEILESGYLTSKDRENESESQLNTMSVKPLFLHTELCHSCNQAYQISQRVQQFGVGVAILLAALAILTNDAGLQRGVVLLAVAALIVTVGANKLKHRFEAYSDSHGIRELRG